MKKKNFVKKIGLNKESISILTNYHKMGIIGGAECTSACTTKRTTSCAATTVSTSTNTSLSCPELTALNCNNG